MYSLPCGFDTLARTPKIRTNVDTRWDIFGNALSEYHTLRAKCTEYHKNPTGRERHVSTDHTSYHRRRSGEKEKPPLKSNDRSSYKTCTRRCLSSEMGTWWKLRTVKTAVGERLAAPPAIRAPSASAVPPAPERSHNRRSPGGKVGARPAALAPGAARATRRCPKITPLTVIAVEDWCKEVT